MEDFLAALGLVLVLEGLLFAAAPRLTKHAMSNAVHTADGTLRIIGLVSAVIGLVVVWLVRR